MKKELSGIMRQITCSAKKEKGEIVVMKKQKSMGNKGFSLVELIIVIAIMAILVGVMAPQLIKYVEKTNVSNDVQVADSVRTAIQTAMLDPTVINDTTSQTELSTYKTTNTNLTSISSTSEFGKAVLEILTGSDSGAFTDVTGKLKSKGAKDGAVMFRIQGKDVVVWITNTDKNGKGEAGAGKNTGNEIIVPTSASIPS